MVNRSSGNARVTTTNSRVRSSPADVRTSTACFPGFGVGPDADDGVVREDQRFAALVAGADGVRRQRQSGDAADLNGHRRCQEEAGHGGVSVTRARKLPSFKWAITSSPGCTSLTDTAGLPQRLPSGFATIA